MIGSMQNISFGFIFKFLLIICFFYSTSISLTFYNKMMMSVFPYPIAMTLFHLLLKFVMAALLRRLLECRAQKPRTILSWRNYALRICPAGIATALDIGLSNWSFEFITISLYTMTKSSAVVFVLLFGVILKLEKPHICQALIILLIAGGLFLFTYESTSFHFFGFTLVLSASVLSGIRWTLNQFLMQKDALALSHPLDMMYHIQPWMIIGLLPLFAAFEAFPLALNENFFRFHNLSPLLQTLSLLFIGALIAFFLEFSEFLLVTQTSSLTLAISGIFKELCTLALAVFINHNQINFLKLCGLFISILGICLHIYIRFKGMGSLKQSSDEFLSGRSSLDRSYKLSHHQLVMNDNSEQLESLLNSNSSESENNDSEIEIYSKSPDTNVAKYVD